MFERRLKSFQDVGAYAYAYAPVRKNWIGAAIGAVSGLASTLIGGSASARKMEEYENQIKAREAANEAWYKRRYNENYLDTAAGQNIVRQARELADRQTKKVEGAAAVGGATDAAVAMQKEGANNAVSNAMSNIAAHDTARKDNIDAINRQNQDKTDAMKMNLTTQQAQNISNVASGVGNALSSAGNALDSAGVFDKLETKLGVPTKQSVNKEKP